MSKRERQEQILDVIRTHRISSQESLREILLERGTDVTQATLSRDVRELRLVKVPGADGVGYYSVPEEWESTPSLESLLPTLFHSADGVDNLLVVRTLKGAAQAVAAGIDWEEWPEVLGTLAGDDTILIILRDAGKLSVIRQRLEAMASHD
ncbi:MAG: arginine repressor [Longimicrobiales bacterium]|nr:arginine repressor [Longimicrobiales bacterium]